MQQENMGVIIAIVVAVVLLAFGAYYLSRKPAENSGETATTTARTAQPGSLSAETVKPGEGAVAEAGDEVTVHYVGTLENGSKFDSSRDRGEPFVFTLGAGQVIRGWDMGVEGMKVGETRKLVIPGDLAYGPQGIPGTPIGPNATLLFEVELLAVKK